MRDFSLQFFLKVGELLITIPVNPEELEITKELEYDTYANLDKQEILKLQEEKLMELELESVLEQTVSSASVTDNPWKPDVYLNKFNEWKDNRQIVRVTSSDGQIDFEGYIVEVTTTYEGGTDEYGYVLRIIQERGIELVTNIDYSYSKIDIEYNVLRYTPPTNPKANTNTSNANNASSSTSNSSVTYTVKRGDTLSGIAKMYYGNSSKWTDIYNANKDKIKNPSLIYPGQVLTIPNSTGKVYSTSSSSGTKSTSNKASTKSSSSSSSKTNTNNTSSNSNKPFYKKIQGVEFWGTGTIHEYDKTYNASHGPDGWWVTYFYPDSGTFCTESSGTAHSGQVIKVGYISSYKPFGGALK